MLVEDVAPVVSCQNNEYSGEGFNEGVEVLVYILSIFQINVPVLVKPGIIGEPLHAQDRVSEDEQEKQDAKRAYVHHRFPQQLYHVV